MRFDPHDWLLRARAAGLNPTFVHQHDGSSGLYLCTVPGGDIRPLLEELSPHREAVMDALEAEGQS